MGFIHLLSSEVRLCQSFCPTLKDQVLQRHPWKVLKLEILKINKFEQFFLNVIAASQSMESMVWIPVGDIERKHFKIE